MKRFLIALTVAILTVISPGTAQAAIQQDKNAAVLDHPLYDPKDYGTACPVGGSGPLVGNENAEKAFLFLLGKGLSAAQAAGIVGNLHEESGVDPAVEEDGRIVDASYKMIPEVGFGIAQWTFPSRQADLAAFQASSGRTIIDLSMQLDFLWKEFSASPALASLKLQLTPENAARDFHITYERSKDDEAKIQERVRAAEEIYEKYKHHALGTLPGLPTGGSSSACPSTGGGGTGSSNFMEDFVIYNQCAYPPFGGPWGNRLTPWGQTMCQAACGPTALAMVAKNMTGAMITPDETINVYTAQGYWVPGGGGSFIAALGKAGDSFGLTTEPIANKGDLNAYRQVFAKGGLVIVASRGTSPFLSYGHAIVLRGITADNKFLIADPGYKETNISPANEFSVDKILTDIRSDGYSAAFAYYKK